MKRFILAAIALAILSSCCQREVIYEEAIVFKIGYSMTMTNHVKYYIGVIVMSDGKYMSREIPMSARDSYNVGDTVVVERKVRIDYD